MGKKKTYTRESLFEVINSLPIAISVIDKNRRVALVNKSTARFVNKQETQLLGILGGEALNCIHSDDVPAGCGFGQNCIKCKLRLAILDTLENRVTHNMIETTMMFKDHGQRHLQISTQPLLLDNEVSALLSIQDVTESKKHELMQMEKERLSAAVKTAGAICHEINQPLMIILGMAELVLEDIEETDPRSPNLREIKKQAERMGHITRKLLSITDFHTRPYLTDEILDLDKSTGRAD